MWEEKRAEFICPKFILHLLASTGEGYKMKLLNL
jgi:hypothetical protein